MEFSKNQRGNNVLTYLGFEYNQYRENKVTGLTTWRCRQHRPISCNAVIKTNGNSIVGELPPHTHDSCPLRAKVNIATSKMKENIKHAGATIRSVIGNEMVGMTEEILAYFPKQASIKRNLLRHRKGGPNPNTDRKRKKPIKIENIPNSNASSIDSQITETRESPNSEYRNSDDEFTYFGLSIAAHLRKMSINNSLRCQIAIHKIIMKERLSSRQSDVAVSSIPEYDDSPQDDSYMSEANELTNSSLT